MAKKFNLSDWITPSTVSNLDTMEISLIPWDKIRANDANFYTVDDVSELVNSIQMHGLLEPVIVTPGEDDSFLLISGHRRHKAWGVLREEDPDRYAKIPAMVRHFESQYMTELALIMANSTARVLSPAEVGRQAERVERLLYELKEEGYVFTGRMRDQVAKACQVSASRIGRLKVIREKLAPEWGERWETGKLPEDTAYKLAQLPREVQARMFYADAKAVTARAAEIVGGLMVNGTTYDGTQLKLPGCRKCPHGDAFLRHDLSDPWNPCEGRTCCVGCEKATRQWSPCPKMCSKAKERRQAASAAEKEKAEQEQKKRESRLRTQIREHALRFVKAADAAGLDDDATIPLTRWGGRPLKWIRAAAEENGDIGPVYEDMFDPDNLCVSKVAKALGCSADYVCGLTDDLQPEAEEPKPERLDGAEGLLLRWIEGTPAHPGRYLCTVNLGSGEYHEQQCDFVDGEWKVYGRTLDGLFSVVAWWPLPPKAGTWMFARKQEEDEDEGID